MLGQGGSGVVYDARWGPRRVALKVLHAGLAGTGRERAQFLAEATKLQQIWGNPTLQRSILLQDYPAYGTVQNNTA